MKNEEHPLVFANHVLEKFVSHTLGDEIEILPNDYIIMRTVYRKLNGSWQEVAGGSMDHTRLLIQVVKSWGKVKGADRKKPTVV